MNKRKIFAVIISAIFLTTTFTGCSKGGIIVIGGIIGGIGTLVSGTADLITILKENGLIESSTENNKPDNTEKNEEKENISESDKKESKQDSDETSKDTIIYKRFKDNIYGFSFEYLYKGDDKLALNQEFPKQNLEDGKAGEYGIKFDNSQIMMGTNFYGNGGKPPGIKDVTRRISSGEIKIEVKDLGDNTYLLTWVDKKAKKDYIQKSCLGKNHYDREEHHYIRYEYSTSTPENEKKLAQHMIDSFEGGFENEPEE